MSSAFCFLLSLVTIGVGIAALVIGFREQSRSMARVGGSFITVIGVLGLIACVMTG